MTMERIIRGLRPALALGPVARMFSGVDQMIYARLKTRARRDWYFYTSQHVFARACPDLEFPVRTRFGSHLRVNKADSVNCFLYYYKVWEPAITAFVQSELKPGDLFVDVGANIGYYTILAAGLVGATGRVVAYEPSPSVFGRLARNVAANGAGGTVTLCPIAISDRAETVNLYLGPPENVGHTSTVPSSHHHFEAQVEALPLSQALAKSELSKLKVIKIDVEGTEHKVVAGMADLLPRLPPEASILLEVSNDYLARSNISAAQVLEPVVHAGFRLFKIENGYEPEFYDRETGGFTLTEVTIADVAARMRMDLVLRRMPPLS